MDLVNALRSFLAVIDTGSFVAAGERLDLSTAVISRNVAALEAHLGTRLINRSTRRISLSERGERLEEHARDLIERIAAMESEFDSLREHPSGVLRVLAPEALVKNVLAPRLQEFHSRFPALRLDISLSETVSDLYRDGIDVALLVDDQLQGNVIARRLGEIAFVLCAAPTYLADHPIPQGPTDLSTQSTLAHTLAQQRGQWMLHRLGGHEEVAVAITPLLTVNNIDLLCDFARRGQGIAALPWPLVYEDIEAGRLVHVLPEWRVGSYNLYAAYKNREFVPVNIRVFIDYLAAALQDDAALFCPDKC